MSKIAKGALKDDECRGSTLLGGNRYAASEIRTPELQPVVPSWSFVPQYQRLILDQKILDDSTRE